MRSYRLLNGLLAVVVLAATSIASAQTNVQDLADQWTAAYNKHDRGALAALYTQDSRLMLHGAPTVVGRDGIGDFWSGDFDEGNPLTLLKVTHSVDGADMILVHGDYEVVDRDDGARLGFGRFAHIWVLNVQGEWRLDRDLWNERFEPYMD